MRRSIVPPKLRFATALSAFPMWREPVGLGAKRTRVMRRGYARASAGDCGRERAQKVDEPLPLVLVDDPFDDAREPAAAAGDQVTTLAGGRDAPTATVALAGRPRDDAEALERLDRAGRRGVRRGHAVGQRAEPQRAVVHDRREH